jgi:hypothetical protein
MNGLPKNFAAAEEVWRAPGQDEDAARWLSNEAQLTLLWRGLDAGGVVIAVLDMEGAGLPIVYVNQGFEVLTGYSEHNCLIANSLRGTRTLLPRVVSL